MVIRVWVWLLILSVLKIVVVWILMVFLERLSWLVMLWFDRLCIISVRIWVWWLVRLIFLGLILNFDGGIGVVLLSCVFCWLFGWKMLFVSILCIVESSVLLEKVLGMKLEVLRLSMCVMVGVLLKVDIIVIGMVG